LSENIICFLGVILICNIIALYYKIRYLPIIMAMAYFCGNWGSIIQRSPLEDNKPSTMFMC